MGKGQLDIYKASAGSGKTHTLTHKYISFLLGEKAPADAYRHILAVTFTNKATDEMKSRIVGDLYELSRGNGDELQGRSEAERARIQKRAKACLTAILHDYSNFQVCTIDRFFQQLFRSFARELGSFSNYRVELRDEEVLSHVVDEMLSSLDFENPAEGSRVFNSVNEFALEQLRYRSKSSYEKQMMEFASLFVKEDFKMKSAGYNPDPDYITKVSERAHRKVQEFEEKLKALATDAMSIISENGLSAEDFKGASRSGMVTVSKYADGDIRVPSNALLALLNEGPERWFTKPRGKEAVIASLNTPSGNRPGLDTVLSGIVSLFEDSYAEYITSRIVRKNVGVMRIFGSIFTTLGKYLKENNIMLLGETTQALHDMIGGSDTPFIYERTGCWIDHYLLDEFQDFSLMQWDNFRPLLEQSLDNGDGNLIVGDVKQSIYRWRGSDWNTLDSGVERDLAGRRLHCEPLGTNYRSDRAIVEFNNEIFQALTNRETGFFDGDETIARAYADCKQEIHSQGVGHVKVAWLHPADSLADDVEEVVDPALAALKGEIESLQEHGYPRSAIYILVRTNAEAAQVAAQLIKDGIEVITDESLVVGASAFVQRLISVLKYIVNPSDVVNAQVIKETGLDVENIDFSGNSLYDICESVVRSVDRSMVKGEMPYLMTFMDLVLEYMGDYGSDMAGFLKWWDEFGSSQSVSAPSGVNAVRVMTIHKAKGLGCPVVILPFFRSAFTPSSLYTNYMWCNDVSSLEAGLLPVEFTKEAGASTFREDYEKEVLNYKMDALNTAYVAFTRAQHELIVFARNVKNKPGVADVLYGYLSASGKLVDDLYEIGSREDYQAAGDAFGSMESLTLEGYDSIPMEGSGEGRKRLSLVLRGSDFFDPEGRDAARRRGIVLHDILSKIDTEDDVASAVDAAVEAGELPAAEREDTESRVRAMLAGVTSYGWFDAGVEALNELSIIDTDGKIWRPDRVVIRGGGVTVVDYKFGIRHGGYRAQVRRYMDMLRRMGYQNVEGYLWYAAENNIEKVD